MGSRTTFAFMLVSQFYDDEQALVGDDANTATEQAVHTGLFNASNSLTQCRSISEPSRHQCQTQNLRHTCTGAAAGEGVQALVE